MAGEVCTFMDAFDVLFIIFSDTSNMLVRAISVSMFTNSKQLFNLVTKENKLP